MENPEYLKDNGVSVLRAKPEIRDPFLLLMSDHIFEPETARALLHEPLHDGEVTLAVDKNIDSIFDLDDATKVRMQGERIVEIGKNLRSYNALDTGMFHCTPALFQALESSMFDSNARCPTACGCWHAPGSSRVSTSERPTGRIVILPKRWTTPRTFSPR